mgnify:CR=1 FL=1
MKYFEFIKMHGLGNDFVIIDNRQNLVKIKNKETLKKIASRNSIATNFWIPSYAGTARAKITQASWP